ncbi:MAG: DUF3048 domain-containing protein [Actinomycetota bacterium]
MARPKHQRGTRAFASILLVVGLHGASIAAIAQVPPLPPGGSFLDDDTLAAEASIEALFADGITHGCGPSTFCPDQSVTRGQMAVFIGRALGMEPSTAPTAFPDIPAEAYFTGYVATLHDRGIIAGYPDGTYRPAQAVTRAEMAALLARALQLKPAAPGATFSDVAVGDWYAPSVEAIRAEGITVGCAADRFCPQHPVLRQQMALFLVRAFHLTPIAPPPRYGPLNGLPVGNGFAVSRRMVAVKIDNASAARPQSGLQAADAVIEIPVEDDLTRLVGLFHQTDLTYVGPVRSARPTDAVLVPLGAAMVISGAQPWIADQVAAEGVSIIRENEVQPPVMWRIPTRRAPHNLYTNTIAVRAEANRRGYANAAPPDMFRFGSFQDWAAPKATSINVSWSSPIQVTWDWDGVKYLRGIKGVTHLWQDEAGNTGQVAARTLVMIFGRRYLVAPTAGVPGSSVPAVETVGYGRLLMFSHGRVVEGTWTRSDASSWFRFESGGVELVVSPGVPWISIVPDDRPVTWR